MTKVDDLWRDIAAQSNRTGLFRRVDDSHPLDLYAGVDHQGKRVLLLVVRNAPQNIPSPGIVEIVCNQRGDAEWAIIVQLARPEFDELFGRLCQDLIDGTRESTPATGGEARRGLALPLLCHRPGGRLEEWHALQLIRLWP